MSSYIPIASQTLTAAAASVTFSSIPTTVDGKTLRDLVVVCDKLRSEISGRTFRVRLNGDTASSYSEVTMYGNGSSAVSSTAAADHFRFYPFNLPAVPGQEPTFIISLFDYAQTDKHKSILTRTANWDAATVATAGRYASTNATTEISFFLSADNIAAGATFSLYGIEA